MLVQVHQYFSDAIKTYSPPNHKFSFAHMIGDQLQNYDTKSLFLAAESLSHVRTFAFHI